MAAEVGPRHASSALMVSFESRELFFVFMNTVFFTFIVLLHEGDERIVISGSDHYLREK